MITGLSRKELELQYASALDTLLEVKKENAELKARLDNALEFKDKLKHYGTDECPDCPTAPAGMNYQRCTLFYAPCLNCLEKDKELQEEDENL